MRAALILLAILAASAASAPIRVSFDMPESLHVAVSLVVPQGSDVAARKRTESGDSVRVRLADEGESGLVVEVTDARGKRLWSHDFGFNHSAPNGCEIAVASRPASGMILVHYFGYKWDHDHRLLFVSGGSAPTVREYSDAKRDILPLLRRQKDFDPEHDYLIYPTHFTDGGIEFECIPIQKPERQAAHPFAQHQQWYRVTATVDAKQKIIPTDVRSTH